MDRFYSKKDAMLTIEALTKERAGKDPLHLARLYKDQQALDNVGIVHDKDDQVWRLSRGPEDGGIDEVVFMVMGAIAWVDLPPVYRDIGYARENTLPQPGSDHYKPWKRHVQKRHREHERGEKQGRERLLAGAAGGLEARPISRKSEQEDGVPLMEDIDPNGVLARLAGVNLIHTEDNVVKYFRGMLDGKKKRYIPARPQVFRLGDIVEAQCLVVFVKSKGGGVKMKLILRALALVNCEHAMVSHQNTQREERHTELWNRTRSENERKAQHEGYGHGTQKVKCKVSFEYSDEDEKEEQPMCKCRDDDEQGNTGANGQEMED
ncbi:hypothetical protein EV421DRAFT_1906806 [Armillaria borealis]|uniref:Uncharacterized protein n=1 Tax=Armillaria borealis TaxID=47425 RepID=A0AA39MKJ4_9AGAR|nr:hypothetical protein EV421DRAFT_1906806 [Armillaria borealis]